MENEQYHDDILSNPLSFSLVVLVHGPLLRRLGAPCLLGHDNLREQESTTLENQDS